MYNRELRLVNSLERLDWGRWQGEKYKGKRMLSILMTGSCCYMEESNVTL